MLKPESAWQNMCVARGYEASLSLNLAKKYSHHLYVTLIISISVYQTVVIWSIISMSPAKGALQNVLFTNTICKPMAWISAAAGDDTNS